jgi:ribosomal-protein-alanine N-acetyltransferase
MLLEVRADNIAAISLYESFGFVINGRRRDYYGAGQDAVLMQRDAQ